MSPPIDYGFNPKRRRLRRARAQSFAPDEFAKRIGSTTNPESPAPPHPTIVPLTLLTSFLAPLELDTRGNPRLNSTAARAKVVAYAGLGLLSALDPSVPHEQLVSHTTHLLKHILPPRSKGQYLNRVFKALHSLHRDRPPTPSLSHRDRDYDSHLASFLRLALTAPQDARDSVAKIAYFSLLLISGLYNWPKRSSRLSFTISIVAPHRYPFRPYMYAATEALQSAALALRRELHLLTLANDYRGGYHAAIDPRRPIDIVMIHRPWLQDFLSSPVCAFPPAPLFPDTLVFVINKLFYSDLLALRPTLQPPSVSLTAALALARSLRKRDLPLPVFNYYSPWDYTLLLTQLTRTEAPHSPIWPLSPPSRAMVDELLNTASRILPAGDELDLVRLVHEQRASFTIDWSSHVAAFYLREQRLQPGSVIVVPLAGAPLDGSWYLGVRADGPHPQAANLIARALAAPFSLAHTLADNPHPAATPGLFPLSEGSRAREISLALRHSLASRAWPDQVPGPFLEWARQCWNEAAFWGPR